MPLIGNVLKPLAKNVLLPLGLTVVASATDAAIHKKMFRSGFITLIISNEDMNDIEKIFFFFWISLLANLSSFNQFVLNAPFLYTL